MPIKAVIFDLDETLIHSNINFRKMKERVISFLEERGVSKGLLGLNMLNVEITRKAIEDLKRKGLPAAKIKVILRKVNEIMNETELESLSGARPVEGAAETLRALKERGVKVGVMTRSCREYAERALSKFGLKRYVDAVSARDDVEKPKPNPQHADHILKLLKADAESSVLVGDHWLDGVCARRAGLRFILVSRRKMNLSVLDGFNFKVIRNIKELLEKIEE